MIVSLFFIGIFGFIFLPPKGYIPIMMYHFVVSEHHPGDNQLHTTRLHFERQMKFLTLMGFHPITLNELFEIKMGIKKPRGREVVITFDDGNETFIPFALPILEKYHVPAANFLVSESLRYQTHGSMSLDDAKQISTHPLVTLGSHTLTHPNLTRVSLDQAANEIELSKRNLEEALSQQIEYLSYPEGFHHEGLMEMVRKAGYKLAFTTSRKRLSGRSETPYSMTRLKVNANENLLMYWFDLSGLTAFFERVAAIFHQLTG